MNARPDTLTPADGYAALDWLARTCTPAWLDAAGLPAEATKLRALPPLLDMDAIRAAAQPLREKQTAAYIRSGVLHWSDVDACDRPFGALAAKNTASAITGYSQLDPNNRTVSLVAGYAWTAASYAAHAMPNEECRTVAGKLAASLPPGVEG